MIVIYAGTIEQPCTRLFAHPLCRFISCLFSIH